MQYIVVLAILILCSYIYVKIADRYGILDTPNHRSSHSVPVIRGGGVLFFIAVCCYYIFFGIDAPYFFAALSIIALVSFIDDLNPLAPLVRFPVQMLCVGLVMYQIGFEFYIPIVILLFIAGLAFINAFNFMDGINGITAIYSIVVFTSLLVLNIYVDVPFMSNDMVFFLLLSLGVFSFFNFRIRARFFAGDIGSFSLGLSITYLCFLFLKQQESPIVLILLAVYGVDTLCTILRRIKMREKLSEGHRHHLYQMLVDKTKLNQLQVSMIYAGGQLILIPVLVFALGLEMKYQYLLTVAVLFIYISIYYVLIKRLKSK